MAEQQNKMLTAASVCFPKNIDSHIHTHTHIHIQVDTHTQTQEDTHTDTGRHIHRHGRLTHRPRKMYRDM